MEERITLNHRYEIIDKIGGGGMAEVFHGYDTVLHRDVGIKILRDQFIQDKDFVARFRQEACNAAGLSHPNIVNIYDCGSEHDIHYIVMEYVVGRTLKEVIEENGPLDYLTAVKYAIGIASALKHAHDHSIVHCDVKSQNILINTKGIAKITDFGIARAFGQPSNTAGDKKVIGSVYYLSPEQAAGQPVTPQSDLYSLGVVLFEMLTGKLPYDGATPVEVARQHLESSTPSARRYDPDIPYYLDAVITKALAKNPRLRYANDDDFLTDLQNVQKRLQGLRENDADQWGHTGSTEPVSQQTIVISKNEMLDGLLKTDPVPNHPAEPSHAQAEPPKKDHTKKMAALFIGIIVLLCAAIYGIVGYSTGDIVVPDVKGKTIAEAEILLKEKKLAYDLNEEYDSKVTPGVVIKQDPGANARVKEGRTIHLTVSKGAEPGVVPDLKNKSLAEATSLLKAAKLSVGKVTVQYKEGMEQGVVLSQSVAPNKKVSPGTLIDVVVNISEGQTVVPSLKGMQLSDAKSRLTSMGLILGSVKEETNDEAKGVVISSSPDSGEVVSRGAVITLTVSAGKKEEPKPAEPVRTNSGNVNKTYSINFTVPGSGSSKQVKIVASDATSSRVLYSGTAAPGTRIHKTVTLGADASVQFYVNGALVEDRAL
jgi:serine/threonine protein kinase/beta-lactam-binding protein with PASTA domain